jgi:hypothetical protein
MAPSERAKQVMTAARTDPAVAHLLACWYGGGEEGLFQSPGLAFRWNLRAAEKGHVDAQFAAGCAYSNGEGVDLDSVAATMWFDRAAEQGDVNAQFNLGIRLEQGKGTPQNYELAAKWYQRAANQGQADAMAQLGALYDKGYGVGQDHTHANALYREAIDVDNDTNALHNLGVSYFKGRGVEKDLATAYSFWQRAADTGHASSQYNIGEAYKDGVGGYDKNNELVRRYIKASAAQGNNAAIAMLKEMNACSQCGADAAPDVCSGCMTERYCNPGCQLAHWTDATDPHRAHCGGERCPCCWDKLEETEVCTNCQCAHCGADAAPLICQGCLAVRYCDEACRQQHWMDPAHPHRAHCGGERCICCWEKTEEIRECANCGAHDAAMSCSACFLGGGVKVRYCGEACQQQHWRRATDPHKATCHETLNMS